MSRPLGEGSQPVGAGSGTIGEASDGSMHSRPVRDPGTRGMLSGPVSEMSSGPMYQPRPSISGDSITETSAGAVKHDIASPLGERISQPLRELGPLQEQMRQRREQAERAALAAAAAPVSPPIVIDEPAAANAAHIPEDTAARPDEDLAPDAADPDSQ